MNHEHRKTAVSAVMADTRLGCRATTVTAPTGWKPVGHDSRDGRLPCARNRRKKS